MAMLNNQRVNGVYLCVYQETASYMELAALF